jgi:preprotein translocase subunit SecA
MGRLSKAYQIGKQTDKRVGFLDAYELVDSYRLLDEINALDPQMREKSDGQLRNYTSQFKQRLSDGETLNELLPEAYAVVREAARRIYGENGDSPEGSARADPEKCKEIFGTDPDGKTLDDAVAKFGRHYDVQVVGGIELHNGNVAEMYTGEGKTLVATMPAYLNALTGEGVHVITTDDYLARRDAKWMAPLFNFLGMSVGARYEANGDQNGAEVYLPGETEKNQPERALRKEAYDCDITYGTVSRMVFDHLTDKSAQKPEERVQRGHNFALIDEVDLVLLDKANIPHILGGQEPLTHRETELVYTADAVARELIRGQERLTGERKDTPKDLENFYMVDEKRNLVCIDETGFKWMENNLEGLLFGKYDSADVELIDYVTKALQAHILYEKDRQYQMVRDPRTEADDTVNLIYKIAEKLISAQKDSGSRLKRNMLYDIDKKGNTAKLTKKGIAWIRKNAEMFREYARDTVWVDEPTEDEVEGKISPLANLKQGDKALDMLNFALTYCALYGGNKPSDKVILVNESTGKPMPNNRYKDGLHEAIEAKEGVNLGLKGPTLGTITTPFYFANYKKRAGMTGTAVEARKEFADVYGMKVVPIPTNKPVMREDHPDVICGSKRAKFEAIADEVERVHETGRPVLVGTTSIEDSKYLARILEGRGLKKTERAQGKLRQIITNSDTNESIILRESDDYSVIEEGNFEVLNAEKKHMAAESEIIEKAGRKGAITIATNMAGRGADIAVEEGTGGLYVIGAERHFAGRIDNQLRGRTGRQGDPGDSRFFTSIDDRLYKHVPECIRNAFVRLYGANSVAESRHYTKKMGKAQENAAKNAASRRKKMFEYDSVLDRQRSALYEIRDSILDGEDANEYLLNSIENIVTQIVENAEKDAQRIVHPMKGFARLPKEFVERGFTGRAWAPERQYYEAEECQMVHLDEVRDFFVERQISSIFGIDVNIRHGCYAEDTVKKVCEIVEGEYLSAVRSQGESFSEFEKDFLLKNMDAYWSAHLDELERLLPGMRLRAFAGRKPIHEYLRESSKEFATFMNHISGLAIAMATQKARIDGEIKKIQETDIQEYLLGALDNLVSPTIRAAEEKASLLSEPEITDILEDPSFREWYSSRFSKSDFTADDVAEDDFRDYFLEREMNRQFIGDIRVPVYTEDLANDVVAQLMKAYNGECENHGKDTFENSTRNTMIIQLEEAYGPSQIAVLNKMLKASLNGGLFAEKSNDFDLAHAVNDVYKKAGKKSGEIFEIVEDLALAEMHEQMKGARAEDFEAHPEAQAFYSASMERGGEAKKRLDDADRRALRAAREFRNAYEGKTTVSQSDVRNFLFEQELKRRYFVDLSVEGIDEEYITDEITEQLEKIWNERERKTEENGKVIDPLEYLIHPGNTTDKILTDAVRHAMLSAIGRKLKPSFFMALQ